MILQLYKFINYLRQAYWPVSGLSSWSLVPLGRKLFVAIPAYVSDKGMIHFLGEVWIEGISNGVGE